MLMIIIGLLCIFQIEPLFSAASKIDKLPMKASAKIAVRDGECLCYAFYAGGEWKSDGCFVSRIVRNAGNEEQALIYYRDATNRDEKIDPPEYSNFPSRYLIAIKEGTLLESTGDFGVETNNGSLENIPTGYKGLFYWHYKLDAVKKQIYYESKINDGNTVKSGKSRISINPGYPYWDWMSGMFFAPRFMDTANPGVLYFVIPEALKEPIAITFKVMGKETLVTKAGTFKTYKLGMPAADPFLAKLIGPFSDMMYIWVEDSGRRLIVQIRLPAGFFKLEAVTNIFNGK